MQVDDKLVKELLIDLFDSLDIYVGERTNKWAIAETIRNADLTDCQPQRSADQLATTSICPACERMLAPAPDQGSVRNATELAKDIAEVIDILADATGSALLAGETCPASDRAVIYNQLCHANNILRALPDQKD